MVKRKQLETTNPKEERWSIAYRYEYEGGKALEVGTTFSCRGERGKKYRFIKFVTTDGGECWIDCFGGASGYGQSRSIHPDRVNTSSIRKPKREST